MTDFQVRSPWIGKEYESLPQHKRVMILGESHYTKEGEEYDPTLSVRVIKSLIQGRKFRFFTCVTTAMENEDYNKINVENFWSQFAYANFCQGGVLSGKKSGKEKMFQDGMRAFPQVLDLARPGKILVFSRKSWRYMKEFQGFSVKSSTPVCSEGLLKPAPVRLIQSESESFFCEALCLRHPTGWQGRRVWHPVIKEFLERPVAAGSF